MAPAFPDQAWHTLLIHSKAALAFYAFSSHGVRAGCVLMSLSLITSFQERAGTAKVPPT